MNKKTLLLISLLAMMSFSLKAQWFDFSHNMNDANIGVNVGVVGYHYGKGFIDDTYMNLGVGISVSLVGVYMDFIYQSPEHRFGRQISPDLYRDHTALTINVGYKIPVLSWLNLTPMIGYSNETTGWTDCSTINVDYENHSIYHDYDRDAIYSHFNYGLGLSFKPFDWLEIGGVCTSHALYGNISVSMIYLK